MLWMDVCALRPPAARARMVTAAKIPFRVLFIENSTDWRTCRRATISQVAARRVKPRTHLTKRERVRCQGFGAAARSEQGEYPQRSSTDEQRRRSSENRQPSGLAWNGPLAALLLGHRAVSAMLPRRALPRARSMPAHPSPVCEMGSTFQPLLKRVPGPVLSSV